MSTQPVSTMIQEGHGTDEIKVLAQHFVSSDAEKECMAQAFASDLPIPFPAKVASAPESSWHHRKSSSVPFIPYPVLSPTGRSSPPSSEPATSESESDISPASPSLTQNGSGPTPRATPARGIVSSPLNPSSPASVEAIASKTLAFSHLAKTHVTRYPSEEARVLARPSLSSTTRPNGSRGSMILYRLADPALDDFDPIFKGHMHRDSVASFSGESFVSVSSDSRYPYSNSIKGPERGFVAYAYDPSEDIDTDDDSLHDPKKKDKVDWLSVRGIVNVTALFFMCAIVIGIFVVFPLVYYRTHHDRNQGAVDNPFINSTGQAQTTIPDNQHRRREQTRLRFIDPATPAEVEILDSAEGGTYTLVFSNEFQDHSSRVLAYHVPLCLYDGLVEVRFRASEQEPWARGIWISGVWEYVTDGAAVAPRSSSYDRASESDDRVALFDFISRESKDYQSTYDFDYIRIYERSDGSSYSCSPKSSARFSVSHLLSIL